MFQLWFAFMLTVCPRLSRFLLAAEKESSLFLADFSSSGLFASSVVHNIFLSRFVLRVRQRDGVRRTSQQL